MSENKLWYLKEETAGHLRHAGVLVQPLLDQVVQEHGGLVALRDAAQHQGDPTPADQLAAHPFLGPCNLKTGTKEDNTSNYFRGLLTVAYGYNYSFIYVFNLVYLLNLWEE